MTSFSDNVQKKLDQIHGNGSEEVELSSTELSQTCLSGPEMSQTCEIEKTPRTSVLSLQINETGIISPLGQQAVSKLDSLESYSQEVQEKIDALTSKGGKFLLTVK